MKSFNTKNLDNKFKLNDILNKVPLGTELYICNDGSNVWVESQPLDDDIYNLCTETLGQLLEKKNNISWGKVTARDGLHVRKQGSLEAEIINVLDYGQSVHIIGQNEQWYEIDKPCNGWVYKMYIELSKVQPLYRPIQKNQEPQIKWGRTTAEAGLNIRAEGDINAQIVNVLDYGQRFHIVGENDKWYEIDKPCNGWIYKEYTSLSNTPHTISDNLLQFTKSWEGFSATPYQDAGGNWTIGYGICTYNQRPDYTMTEAEASQQLENTLNDLASQLYEVVGEYDLNQSEFDSLVDFSYNLGLEALRSSTLLRNINACKNNSTLMEDFRMWSYCDGRALEGLLRRRTAEAQMWLYGQYNNN